MKDSFADLAPRQAMALGQDYLFTMSLDEFEAITMVTGGSYG